MKYTIKNNTILDNGFPITLQHAVTLLNTIQDEPLKQDKTMGFDLFWSLYPKKVDKAKSIIIWARLKLFNHASTQDVISKLKTQLSSKDERFNREKQFIKAPSVYLNGQCWNDEIIVKKQDSKKWLTDSEVDGHARIGESFADLYSRLSGLGFNFNKNRS